MFSKSFKVSYFSFNPCLGRDSGSTNPHQVFKGLQWQSQLWTRSQWDRERSRVTIQKGVTGMNNQLFSPQAKLHLEPGCEAGHGWYTLVIHHTGGKDKRIRNSRSSSATRRIRGQSGLQETLDKTKQNKSHIEWARVAICSNRLNRQDVSPVSSRKDWSWKITQVFSKCERKPYLKFMLLTHPKNQNALTALESSAWRLRKEPTGWAISFPWPFGLMAHSRDTPPYCYTCHFKFNEHRHMPVPTSVCKWSQSLWIIKTV